MSAAAFQRVIRSEYGPIVMTEPHDRESTWHYWRRCADNHQAWADAAKAAGDEKMRAVYQGSVKRCLDEARLARD